MYVWKMKWFKELFGTCMEGRQGDKMDWIEVEYSKMCMEKEAQRTMMQETFDEEFVDLSPSPASPTVGSPIPSVCSPVPSLYLVVNKDEVKLFKRPKASLPPIVSSEPKETLSVKDRVRSYEQSLSSQSRPVSPPLPSAIDNIRAKAIKEHYKKPKNVEAELRRYQALKRMQKYDQRAHQEASRKSPICPGLGGSGRYRSPTYPPSHILTSPYRSLQ
jgi:hypothetical protein